MRRFFLLLVAIPTLVSAQPEKVKVGMSLDEFLSICPKAERDWDMESETVTDDSAMGKVAGTRKWTYYNDTIRFFEFKSEPVYGPCAEFPKGDSTKVHAMREEAEKVRKAFELKLGPPKVFENYALSDVGPGTVQYCYKAMWVLHGNRLVRIWITNDGTPKNQINAPASSKDKTSGIYTMYVYIDSWDNYFKQKYAVGCSTKEFVARYPVFKSKIEYNSTQRSYIIMDSSVCDNAAWEYDFDGQEMFTYSYEAEYGTGYGAGSDAEAYNRLKRRAEQMMKNMTALYGEPDSVSNKLTPAYAEHDKNVRYERVWLRAVWETDNGDIEVEFSEEGGGKNPDVVFYFFMDWSDY